MLITRPFAYNESLQHTTIAVSLIKILIFFRPLSSVHLLQGNQRFEAIDGIHGPTRFGKVLSLIFPKLSSQNMRGSDQRFLFLVSTVSATNAWHNDPLLCHKYEEKRVGDY